VPRLIAGQASDVLCPDSQPTAATVTPGTVSGLVVALVVARDDHGLPHACSDVSLKFADEGVCVRLSRSMLSIGLALASLPVMGGAASADSAGSEGLLISQGAGTYELDPSTGDVTRTVSDGGVQAVYSPSGSQLAYVHAGFDCPSEPDGCYLRQDLMTSNANGANARVLVPAMESETGEAYAIHPDWAPSGKRIAFESPRGLGLVNADGSGLEFPELWGSKPAFSPDGTTIAYLRTTSYEGPEGWETGTDIWVMDLATRESRALTTDHGGSSSAPPDWSPDGRSLVYGNEYGLKTVDVTTGEQRDLYDPSASFSYSAPRTPVHSPDGTRIAFVAWDAEAAMSRVYVIGSDGSGLRPIADTGGELTDWIEN
jgi:TolB protein